MGLSPLCKEENCFVFKKMLGAFVTRVKFTFSKYTPNLLIPKSAGFENPDFISMEALLYGRGFTIVGFSRTLVRPISWWPYLNHHLVTLSL
jgi:hypothetical protein